MRSLASVVVALLLSVSIQVQAQAPAPAPADGPPRNFPREIYSSVQGRSGYAGGIVGLLDLTYATVPGFRPLKLDLYYSPKTRTARPAVIWIHGGGWMNGTPRNGTELTGERDRLLARMSAHGYVTVGLSYRFSGEARFPAAVNDVKAAVRWLRANAATYHIDPQRIAVWGASAGGYLAAMAGTTCGVKELEGEGGNPEQSSCVQAVVDWFGATDFKAHDQQTGPDMAATNFLGCPVASCPADLLRQANPLTYISASSPPFLIMHGAADVNLPIEQSRMLYDALRAQGVKAQFIAVPGVGHEWSGANQQQIDDIYATVRKFLDATFGVRAAAR